MLKPKVKICCISSPEEAALAIRYGASALGLVGKMPSGPGVIEDTLIKQIAATVPPPVATFLLTSETKAEHILEHHYLTHTNTLQLVDYLEHSQYHQLHAALPWIKLVQVIHVLDESDISRAKEISPFVDALLLDSGNPNLTVKILGGTGNTHNWEISRKIRESVPIPVFLAGGLNAMNVKEAIATVQPWGLDLCSSVRTNGHLDEAKLKAFFDAVNAEP
ncbi:MAG TPA: phosphoribosylanthranilate isomerase [Chitinophagaceae bacterium]|nr:phosphoribosylanthranilate isomerase [Chitinophagaceae bacterium]